jgi:hypothetical protein
MAKQIVARQQGDDYQARWFWLQACALLDDFSKVERVVHEDDTLKSFDDVAVYYRSGYTNNRGMPLDADFYQVKFHLTSNGAITGEAFCDPGFIGATTVSLLQKMKNASDHCCSTGINHRLFLYTPWTIHPDDHLATLHSLRDGSIRWNALADGGDRSKSGKLRKRWRDHLGLKSDDELRPILANIRIQQGPTLNKLADDLNWRLKAVGLRPVADNNLNHPYDDLTRKMLANNMNELTVSSLLDLCGREGLLVRTPTRPANTTTSLGIRSFLRWAEDLQNQTQSMICLSHHFEGRRIINPDDWNIGILNSLENFVQQHIARGGSYRLHLDTHFSIAFLAGHFLPEKMGINVEVVQHSGGGINSWNFTNVQGTSFDSFEFVEETCHHGGADWALAIGLTHDIKNDVLHYIGKSLPSVGHAVLALPAGGPSSSSVRDGTHAECLASQLIHYIRTRGAEIGVENRVHVFSAAPNGFTFCLGRKMHPFHRWTLYEFDFGSGKTGAYSPSSTNDIRR